MEAHTFWTDLVDNKDNFIGGTLSEYGLTINTTPIVDIKLTPNDGSTTLTIVGEDFECIFDTKQWGLFGAQTFNKDYMKFTGYGGKVFSIEKHIDKVD